jgi:DNA polymerase epsilon subunit 1
MASKKGNIRSIDDIELELGWETVYDSTPREGYLINMKPHSIRNENTEFSCLLLYFSQENGRLFKTIVRYEPYFYIVCKRDFIYELTNLLSRHFQGLITQSEIVEKVDLSLLNHLSGITTPCIKLSFNNVQDLLAVRTRIKNSRDTFHGLEDMREFDVIYYTRVSIDLGIRCGMWYRVSFREGAGFPEPLHDKLTNPGLRVLAFDIETCKQPLKFPDSNRDKIMMISYMIDGQGFLITNREIVAEDIEDFEYTPKKEYPGHFSIFNVPTEYALLLKFFSHIRETTPIIYVTFNGDGFDWPYIEARASKYGLNLQEEIGIINDNGEYKGRYAVHMDCFCWVKRDAYLPQGSHGLKMVTKAKLGYNPVELDPEEMVPMAREKPQVLATYSVSDAVATYYLYKKMIHDFIFALCTIIPLHPDDVLRKGSGTLCEQLLMAQAFQRNILFPNKSVETPEKFYNGHLIESETYIGGHVECLEVGVYRSDIPVKFKLKPEAYQMLIDGVPDAVDFCCRIEHKIDPSEIINRDEVIENIRNKLSALRDAPRHSEFKPLIYHLDVAAMYPNIILSNRLQPTAIVNDKICTACVYNRPENECKRKLNWEWRGELFPLKRGEFEGVKDQISKEVFNGVSFNELPAEDKMKKLKDRVKEYCKRAYNTVHLTKVEVKSDTVCMRENSFYVDTVRAFRDRRYEFKNLVKVEKKKFDTAAGKSDLMSMKEADERMNLFESLQLAHKIILNSFYGYVMRKGARWYSMEMAGMVTHTGANIITDSRKLVEQIGRPLELDTDGIWCLLPATFPENFSLKTRQGAALYMSYPCTMLNLLIYDKYKNPQYQTQNDNGSYEMDTEMSVFFEIDGPYRAMLIPASTEEGKMLKKRYAVFNHEGRMTEIKGFELKRRGELKLIKVFQEEIFSQFLCGSNLTECYNAAGTVAHRWYSLLENKGQGLCTSELIDYLCENRVLSKPLIEYGAQKSTSITTARRLAEMLGEEIVKDKGLNCQMLISKKPEGATVTERAIPAVIFSVSSEVRNRFLKTWLREGSKSDLSIKDVIDWDYYKERLRNTIQKIITIPAALQRVPNPNPNIEQPDWLKKKVKDLGSIYKQRKIDSIFTRAEKKPLVDIEDMASYIPKKPAVPELMDVSHAPDPDTDFSGWLSIHKQAWIQRRKHNLVARKIRKEISSTPRSMEGFLRNRDQELIYSSLHLIGIYTRSPGVFNMWVITDNKEMHCIRLDVPRTIYISSSEPQVSNLFKPTKLALPHNKSALYLYEYTISEEEFLEKAYLLNNALADYRIEAVYESQISPLVNAVIGLKTVVKIKEEKAQVLLEGGNILGNVYNIDDFESKVDSDYLSALSHLHCAYLINASKGVRSVWALFLPMYKKVLLYIAAPGQVDKNSYSNVVKESISEWETICEYKKENRDCLKELSKILSGETRLVLLTGGIYNELIAECPRIYVGQGTFEMPALDWQRMTIRYLCEQFLASKNLLNERIGLASYSGIPVGNLQEDPEIFASDIQLARSLRFSKSIVWWSDSPKPDLGGEDYAYKAIEDYDFSFIKLTRAGLYSTVCIEMDMGVLAVNSILCYKHLFTGDGLEDNMDDLRVLSLQAFKRVRGLVSTWVQDVNQSRNAYADKLVLNFYRWLSSPTSAMYDPILHYTLHDLVQQIFKHLIQDIEKLSCTIIYAHSDKLIIDTGKQCLIDAQNYFDFFTSTINSNPSFTYLSLEATRYWQILLFKDLVNYSGILARESITDSFKIATHWHIVKLLPEKLNRVASAILAEFIHKAYVYLKDAMMMENVRIGLVEYLKQLISKELSHKLFEYIEANIRYEEHEWPERMGSQLVNTNPWLAFVKITCHALGLESQIEDDINILRKNLLRILRVSDFASEAEYGEPWSQVVIPEIVCKSCLYCRDVDLCSDPYISDGKWCCPFCHSPLNSSYFEQRLITLVQKDLNSYLSQDLRCIRCKHNQVGYLSRHCTCSGKFVNTRSRETLEHKLKSFSQVAHHYKFQTLSHMIHSISLNAV